MSISSPARRRCSSKQKHWILWKCTAARMGETLYVETPVTGAAGELQQWFVAPAAQRQSGAPTVTRTQASSGNSFWTVPTRSLTWLTLSVISLDSSAVILMETTFSMPLAPSTTGTPTK